MKKLILGIVFSTLVLGSVLVANNSSPNCCNDETAECCYEGSVCCE